MPTEAENQPDKIEAITPKDQAQTVSNELGRLIAQLRSEFAKAEAISFEYTDELHLHVDVRSLEEAHIIQARLPALCGGIFSEVFIGSSPHHPFFHRVSALADK